MRVTLRHSELRSELEAFIFMILSQSLFYFYLVFVFHNSAQVKYNKNHIFLLVYVNSSQFNKSY
jgi:hypothetical protein